MYSNSRYSGSSRSTWDCGMPSTRSVHARGRPASATSSATPESMSARTAGPLLLSCRWGITPVSLHLPPNHAGRRAARPVPSGNPGRPGFDPLAPVVWVAGVADLGDGTVPVLDDLRELAAGAADADHAGRYALVHARPPDRCAPGAGSRYAR